MAWNWTLPDWPHFTFSPEKIAEAERSFLLLVGESAGYLETVGSDEELRFTIEILSIEGTDSSKIEGELLDRESLQISLKRQFNIEEKGAHIGDKESRMAALLSDAYKHFDLPLTHEMLSKWHGFLFEGRDELGSVGSYRTHEEPMQIVSNRLDQHEVYFEAPPSSRLFHEMEEYIRWFNSSDCSETLIGKAAIAHLYFESIHPFEDGNGRIGRVLIEKLLSRALKRPLILAVSKVLEKRRREYYAQLERCNRTLNADHWVLFFANVALEAQSDANQLLHFVLAKSKLLNALAGKLNERQLKVVLRMFAEGPKGFRGGLSAENYLSITKISRATATRDLADLVEKGALKRVGELRHTRYYLNITRPLA